MSNYREKCFESYAEKCVACTSGEQIEVHHIDGNAGNCDERNLIPLCKDCHQEVETQCWTDNVSDPIDTDNPTIRWLIEKKRAYSPNTEASDRDGRIISMKKEYFEELKADKPDGVTWGYYLVEVRTLGG